MGPTTACMSGRGGEPAYDAYHYTSTFAVLWAFDLFCFSPWPNSPFVTLAVNFIRMIAQKDS